MLGRLARRLHRRGSCRRCVARLGSGQGCRRREERGQWGSCWTGGLLLWRWGWVGGRHSRRRSWVRS